LQWDARPAGANSIQLWFPRGTVALHATREQAAIASTGGMPPLSEIALSQMYACIYRGCFL